MSENTSLIFGSVKQFFEATDCGCCSGKYLNTKPEEPKISADASAEIALAFNSAEMEAVSAEPVKKSPEKTETKTSPSEPPKKNSVTVQKTEKKDKLSAAVCESLRQSPFSLIKDNVLRIALDGFIWMRTAAVSANTGNIRFARDPGLVNEGLATFLFKAFTGETSFLAVAQGKGELFLTCGSHKIMLIYLNDETVSFQGCSVLAFEDKLEHSVHMMGNIAGITAGGLFFVTLSGRGWAAVSVCGTPFTIQCAEGVPVSTVPLRALAWSGNIKPKVKTDVTKINLMGRGITDTLQMNFEDPGYVCVHGSEDYMFSKIK